MTGLPKSLEVSSVELRDAISGPVNTIVDLIKAAIEQGLAFPEYSAGRLMQRDVVAVPEYWTGGQTVDYLRPILLRHPPYDVDVWVESVGTTSYTLRSRIVDRSGESEDVYAKAVSGSCARSRALSSARDEVGRSGPSRISASHRSCNSPSIAVRSSRRGVTALRVSW